jgi:hypothetical protein
MQFFGLFFFGKHVYTDQKENQIYSIYKEI